MDDTQHWSGAVVHDAYGFLTRLRFLPQVVHKKMESLGPVHHRNAVHANEHMAVFETVVTTLLQQVCGTTS